MEISKTQIDEQGMPTSALLAIGTAINAIRSGGRHSETITADEITETKSTAGESGISGEGGKIESSISTQYVPKEVVIADPSRGLVQLLRGLSSSSLLSLIHLQTDIEPESAVIQGIMNYITKFSGPKTATPEVHDPSDEFLKEILNHYLSVTSGQTQIPTRFTSVIDLVDSISKSQTKTSDPRNLLTARLAAMNRPSKEYLNRLVLITSAVSKYIKIFETNYQALKSKRTESKMQLFDHWKALSFPVLPLYIIGNVMCESSYLSDGSIYQSGDNGNSGGPFQINKVTLDEFKKKNSESDVFRTLSKDIYKEVKFGDFLAEKGDLDVHARMVMCYYITYLMRKGDPVYYDTKAKKNKWQSFATAFVDVKSGGSEGMSYALWSYSQNTNIEFVHLGNPMWDTLFEMFLHYVASSTDLSSINKDEVFWTDSKWDDTNYSGTKKGKMRYVNFAIEKLLLSSFSIIYADMIKSFNLTKSNALLADYDKIHQFIASTKPEIK